MSLANKIYECMKRKLMSQAAVARAIGISPRKFNDMLNGRGTIHPEHIIPICRVLGCEPNELFGYEKEYHQITVIGADGEVVAAVTGDSVVEHDGYKVILS